MLDINKHVYFQNYRVMCKKKKAWVPEKVHCKEKKELQKKVLTFQKGPEWGRNSEHWTPVLA